jgi:hypothetical protein
MQQLDVRLEPDRANILACHTTPRARITKPLNRPQNTGALTVPASLPRCRDHHAEDTGHDTMRTCRAGLPANKPGRVGTD